MNTPNAAVGGLSVRGLLPTIYDGNGGAYAGFVTARETLKRAQPLPERWVGPAVPF